MGGQETGSDYDDAGMDGVESYRTTTASYEPAWVAFTVDGSGAGTFRAEVQGEGLREIAVAPEPDLAG